MYFDKFEYEDFEGIPVIYIDKAKVCEVNKLTKYAKQIVDNVKPVTIPSKNDWKTAVLSVDNVEDANKLFAKTTLLHNKYKKLLGFPCTDTPTVEKIDSDRVILPENTIIVCDLEFLEMNGAYERLLIKDIVDPSLRVFNYKTHLQIKNDVNNYRLYLITNGKYDSEIAHRAKTRVFKFLRQLDAKIIPLMPYGDEVVKSQENENITDTEKEICLN